jgi:hypothetical protein
MGLASHFAVDYAPIARHDARHLRTGRIRESALGPAWRKAWKE